MSWAMAIRPPPSNSGQWPGDGEFGGRKDRRWLHWMGADRSYVESLRDDYHAHEYPKQSDKQGIVGEISKRAETEQELERGGSLHKGRSTHSPLSSQSSSTVTLG